MITDKHIGQRALGYGFDTGAEFFGKIIHLFPKLDKLALEHGTGFRVVRLSTARLL